MEQLLPSCDHMDPKNEVKTWKQIWPSWAEDPDEPRYQICKLLNSSTLEFSPF